jgi:hypothetical protein
MTDDCADDTIDSPEAGGQPPAAVGAGYAPLPSVWEGTDAELIERMLDFYPRRRPEAILDATLNAGRFWVGSTRPVTGMDIDPRYEPDVVGDNRDMPFADGSFDVVVFDPRGWHRDNRVLGVPNGVLRHQRLRPADEPPERELVGQSDLQRRVEFVPPGDPGDVHHRAPPAAERLRSLAGPAANALSGERASSRRGQRDNRYETSI